MDKQNLDDKDEKITRQKLGKFKNEFPEQGPETDLLGFIGMRPLLYSPHLLTRESAARIPLRKIVTRIPLNAISTM